MNVIDRRDWIKLLGASGAMAAFNPLGTLTQAATSKSDSLATQLYKSLSDEQLEKIVLPVNDKRRQFISNWWYVHTDHRINNTFNKDQQELILTLFDSFHTEEYRAMVNEQVKIDQYGKEGNAPSVGFFGTPGDKDFEFIYTGHHVTRRCDAHSDEGKGFGGSPIFYGHFRTKFREGSNHEGNPYWYQGLIFNEFVEALDGKQQEQALLSKQEPRSEKGQAPIEKKQSGYKGLKCSELSADQQEKLFDTMRRMMAMFRKSDVDATIKTIRDKGMMDRLHVSYYDGKYDIGNDRVWDTWQIEGPDMVWYFRGFPHIHTYFHVKG